jgi:hypothetical protein
MKPPAGVSRRLLDQIVEFCRERCPCSLESRDFIPTFAAIVGVEIERVREEERERVREGEKLRYHQDPNRET